jgi:hypothetical protein
MIFGFSFQASGATKDQEGTIWGDFHIELLIFTASGRRAAWLQLFLRDRLARAPILGRSLYGGGFERR